MDCKLLHWLALYTMMGSISWVQRVVNIITERGLLLNFDNSKKIENLWTGYYRHWVVRQKQRHQEASVHCSSGTNEETIASKFIGLGMSECSRWQITQHFIRRISTWDSRKFISIPSIEINSFQAFPMMLWCVYLSWECFWNCHNAIGMNIHVFQWFRSVGVFYGITDAGKA